MDKSVMRDRIKKRYNEMSIIDVLQAAKQRLITLAIKLKQYTRNTEARRINGLFSKDPSRMYSYLQGNSSKRPNPPNTET